MNRAQFNNDRVGGFLSFLSFVISLIFFIAVADSYQYKNWQESALGFCFLVGAFILERLGV